MANVNLEKQYHLTRAALISAGLDMNGSIDALYRDWRRWREKAKPLALPDRVATGTPTNGGLGIWTSSGA